MSDDYLTDARIAKLKRNEDEHREESRDNMKTARRDAEAKFISRALYEETVTSIVSAHALGFTAIYRGRYFVPSKLNTDWVYPHALVRVSS